MEIRNIFPIDMRFFADFGKFLSIFGQQLDTCYLFGHCNRLGRVILTLILWSYH